MSRRRRVALWLAAALVAGLVLNAVLTSARTEPAEVTVPGGRIIGLPGGDLQIVDRGPRDASPIVLLHGFACSIRWWDRMMPLLESRHRVVAIDLLGHGGSEKPDSGYSMENQAELVSEVLARLGVRDATVVGHSMGAAVATALLEYSPGQVNRLVIVDSAPESDGYGADPYLPVTLTFTPVVGEALWQMMPDFAIEDGLGVGFAPGYDVPDKFVEDFRRLTYASYDTSAAADTAYVNARSLDARLRDTGIPVLALFGAEEQIYDEPTKSLAAYRAVGAQTKLIPDAGHSPNVERPRLTAALVMRFAAAGRTFEGLAEGTKKAAPRGGPSKEPAATYSPRRLPSKYHRR